MQKYKPTKEDIEQAKADIKGWLDGGITTFYQNVGKVAPSGMSRHINTYIDNCWGCAPFWEEYPICPTHKTKLTYKGYCKVCKKHYEIEKFV